MKRSRIITISFLSLLISVVTGFIAGIYSFSECGEISEKHGITVPKWFLTVEDFLDQNATKDDYRHAMLNLIHDADEYGDTEESAIQTYFIMSKWAEQDLAGAINFIDFVRYKRTDYQYTSIDSMCSGIQYSLSSEWVRSKEMDAAAEYYKEMQASPYGKEALLRSIAHKWPQVDEQRAWEWMTHLSRKEQRLAFPDFIFGLAKSSPEKVKYYYSRLSLDNMSKETFNQLTTPWARIDESGYKNWINSIPEENLPK